MSTMVANELISGVNIISQYQSTYYLNGFGGIIFFSIFSFLLCCFLTGLFIETLVTKYGNVQFYTVVGFLVLFTFIFTIGLFQKARNIDIYDITRYKVTITDTAKYNEVNDKLYIITEDHGVYDVYLKSDIINEYK